MTKPFVKPNCATCLHRNEIPSEDISWFLDRNLTLNFVCSNCPGIGELTLEEAKWLQEKRLGLGVVCKDCGELFFISPDEIAWLIENELKLFKRCPSCRQKAKEKRESMALAEVKTCAETEDSGCDMSVI